MDTETSTLSMIGDALEGAPVRLVQLDGRTYAMEAGARRHLFGGYAPGEEAGLLDDIRSGRFNRWLARLTPKEPRVSLRQGDDWTPDDLAHWRESLGLSQKEAGEELGMTGRQYQRLECGKSDIRQLHVLAAREVARRHRKRSRRGG